MNIKLVLACLIFAACKHESPEVSETLGGHMPLTPEFLINLLPGDDISVCSSDRRAASLAADAVKEWAAAIGRQRLNVRVDECTKGPANLHVRQMIQVKTYEESKMECAKYPSWLGGHTIIAFKKEHRIYICKDVFSEEESENSSFISQLTTGINISSKPSLQSTLLHEVGHIWGLCDQYEKSSLNCDANYVIHTPEDASVMGAAHLKKLTWDDLETLAWLAQRPDISANKVWTKALEKECQKTRKDSATDLPKPDLGIYGVPVSVKSKKRGELTGLLVKNVVPGGKLDQVAMKAETLILSVNGLPVKNSVDWFNNLECLKDQPLVISGYLPDKDELALFILRS
jgi:hypothetical protein